MQDPYNHTDNPYPGSENPQQFPVGYGGNRLATAAMLMGILSIAMLLTLMFHLSLIFGSVGIVLALLSKGRLPAMAAKARAGIISSIAGVAFTCLLCITAFTMLYTNPKLMEQVNKTFEQQYGMSYEELMDLLISGEAPR